MTSRPRDGTRAGVSPVMIGRVGPLARLAALVAGAEVGSGDEPAVALVSGEAGIGKTRLVTELLRGTGTEDATATNTVLLGARPGSENRPLDAFTSIIHSIAAADDEPVERTILDHFDRLCSQGPTVVVVDDVHWIDDDSAALVDEMARRPWSSLVLVVTYRSGALRRGSPGGELVARLERTAVDHIRLDRLERNEVGALVEAITGEQPSSAAVDAVTNRSDGNPFVVEELVRVLAKPTGGLDQADVIARVELPWSLGDAVRQQLAGLAGDQRDVVEALAVLDDATEFDVLAAVSGLGADELLAALRHLVAEGIVEEVAEDSFALGHALLADTVTQQLLGRDRRRLHENALDALNAAGRAAGAAPDAAALLRHAVGAGRYDEVLALARAGARQALDAGRTFLALRLAAQGLGEAPDDAELLAVATDAAWRLDFVDEAADAAGRWVGVAAGRDRVLALQFESRVAFERGDSDRALAAAARLEQIADDGAADPGIRAAAAASLAQLYMFSHRTAEAVSWGDRAIADATAIGDSLTAARGRVERSIARTFSGQAPDIDEIRAAIADARAAGDQILTARGIANLLNVLPLGSDDGHQLMEELAALARRTGFDKLAAVVTKRRCDAAIAVGDMAAARRALAEVKSSWMQVSTYEWKVQAEALIAIEEGRFADAERILFPVTNPVTYEGIDVPVNDDPNSVPRLWLTLAALSGDVERGRAVYERVADADEWLWQFSDVIRTIESALAVGIAPARVRDDIVTRQWPAGTQWLGDTGPLAEGQLAYAEGREADAIALLEPRLIEGVDDRLDATTRAALRVTLARAMLAVGERQRAEKIAHLVVYHDLARWPGVRRDRAEELLRRLSTSRATGPRAGVALDGDPSGTLTPREREVAVLLSEGLSNGRLAERLFISPKTAAVHVSNILAKLGLSSRAEVAAWAVRHLDPAR